MSQSPSLRGSGRFGRRRRARRRARQRSQSPSLRGSGRFWGKRGVICVYTRSQSPSLRGSGRFIVAQRRRPARRPSRLNPLHCGAVVASGRGSARSAHDRKSQSPSLRGSGRFGRSAGRGGAVAPRLNPLHCGAVVASCDWLWLGMYGSGLNPLHCGAVVASYERWVDEAGSSPCLNPLHCGAVVASAGVVCLLVETLGIVSIPFIAGQWSLLSVRPSLLG